MIRKHLGNITDDETIRVNFAEYTTKKCGGAGVLALKTAVILICLGILGAGGYLFLSVVKLPVAIVPLLIFCLFVFWLLWKYTNIEYDYTIYKGTMTFGKVYGGRSYKILESLTVSEIEKIEAVEDVRSLGKDTSCYFAEKKCDCLYTLVHKGQTIAFEAPEKTIGALKYYNSRAFSTK